MTGTHTIALYAIARLPLPTGKTGRPLKYPWQTLAIGDTFFAAGAHKNSLHGCASKRGIKITTKPVTIEGVVGIRVTRVA